MRTGSGNNCRKVTFTLDSGAAVSAAPKSHGDDHPMQIDEPRSYKTATGSLVQDERFRVLPIVTEEGLHEFQSGHLFTKHWCQRRKCAVKVIELFWIPSLVQVACFTNTRTNGSGCAKKKGVLRFRWLGFSGNDSWEKEVECPQFDAV